MSVDGFVIEDGILKKYKGFEIEIEIPEGVQSIGESAFESRTEIRSITIPEGVQSIGENAFSRCQSLKSITIPDGVQSIEDYVFSGCYSLTSIKIPNSVHSIGENAFSGCYSLTSIKIPNSVHSIGENAFSRCQSLRSITIPDSVPSIEDNAFSGCQSLKSITIPDSVQSIGNKAFYNCYSLTSITIPDSVQSIGNSAFSGCKSLRRITIPESVQSIGNKAFYNCYSLTSITIPDSVQSIGESAFSGCTLLSVTISDNVQNIRSDAFSECKGLIVSENNPVLSNIPYICSPNGNYSTLTIKMKDGTYRNQGITWGVSPNQSNPMESFDHCLAIGRFNEKIGIERRILAIIDRLKDTKNPVNPNNKAVFVDLLRERILTVLKVTDWSEEDLKLLLKTEAINELNLPAVQKSFKRNNPDILPLCVLEMQEDKNIDPLQQECMQLLQKKKWNTELQKYKLLSFAYVKLKDGRSAPESYSQALTAILMFTWFDETFVLVDQIAKMISIKSYLSVMNHYYNIAKFKKKVILTRPICRFADGETIKSIYSEFEKSTSRNEILDAIMLSRTREAELILYQNHMLNKYAMLHGLNKDLLEWNLMDTGLDKERKKYYDLGDHTIAAHMLSNFTFEFINISTGKVTKTLPKRGADSEKYKKAEKHFKELKQNIRKVAKLRTSKLFSDFLKGKPTEAEIWKKMHSDNPVLHDIGKMIVWRQGKDTFIMRDDRLENCSGNSYEITDEPVYVAHPMDMKDSEILYWQQYFAKNQMKQPFIQIWEPVCDLRKEDLFSNVRLPLYRFVNRDIHGIHVLYKNSDNSPVFVFEDCSAKIVQANRFEEIKHDTKFKIIYFSILRYSKMANHIMAYLLRCVAFSVILKDDDAIIPILPMFTYELISKLLEFAIEKSCTHVSAILLDYREKNFSNYDAMDEFTLDF